MAVRGARATKVGPEKGISGSYDDVERKEFYEGEQPKPGLYPVKLVSVEQHTTTDDAVHWVFEIVSGPYKGWRGHYYTNNSTMKFRQEQCLVGLGLMEEGGTVNLTYDAILKKAKPCRIRVKNEEYNDELRGKVDRVLVASTDAPAPDQDDEPDEDFEDEPSGSKPEPTRARARKKAAEPEPDEDDDEESEEDEERTERLLELEELSLADLKKEAKQAGFTLKDYRGKEATEIIELILDKEFPEEDGDDEGEADELDLEALEEELGELSLAALKKRAKEYGLTVADLKGLDEEEIIETILDKLEGDKELPF